jgi:hypothetical protein
MSKIGDIDSPARYRRLARDCLEMARTVASEGPRATLVEMAQIWMRWPALRKAAKSPSSNNRSSPRPTTRKSRPASRSLQESRGFVPLAEIAQSQVLSPVPMRIKGVEIASCASATGHDRSANER